MCLRSRLVHLSYSLGVLLCDDTTSLLCLLDAPLEERERTSDLHDSHFDRELGSEASTLPASKDKADPG